MVYGRISLLMVMFASTVAWGAVRISDDAPADVRAYLEAAIAKNERERPTRINEAKKAVKSAETDLDDVRVRYRKRKATDADLSVALARVETARKALEQANKGDVIVYPGTSRFDQPGAIGTLPHGMGISRVVDERSAIVYPFVEKRQTVEPGPLFDVTPVTEIEIAPTATPLLLLDVPTSTLKEGEKIAATQTVYRIGATVEIDKQKLLTLTPVKIEQYLIQSAK
jgi:hypothetical protein